MNRPTPLRIKGCREEVPTISMDPDAHYSIPRFWEKVALGRPLSDATIARYQRRGWYARGQFKAPGGTPLSKVVWSA
jgi:hypothetical protein